MNKQNLIPISYVKQFTPLVVGDEIYNSESGSAFVIGNKGDQLKNLNANRNDNYRFNLVSFAARENTGKQPVADDVSIDAQFNDEGHAYDMTADYLDWSLGCGNPIKTWKPNHESMLAKFKEQGANTVKEPESMIGSSEFYQSDNSQIIEPALGETWLIDQLKGKPTREQQLSKAGEALTDLMSDKFTITLNKE